MANPKQNEFDSIGGDPFEGMDDPSSSARENSNASESSETGFSGLNPKLKALGDDPFKSIDIAKPTTSKPVASSEQLTASSEQTASQIDNAPNPFFSSQAPEQFARQEVDRDTQYRASRSEQLSGNLNRFVARFPNLEILFWILASAVAFIAFLIFVPIFFQATTTPTPVAARATFTPRPTLTPIVRTSAIVTAPVTAKAQASVVVPPIPPSAKQFQFTADPRRTGWLTPSDEEPHWGDRNLHAGVYKGLAYQSIIGFEASTLAPGSKIIWADVELSGLNGSNIASSGRWSLKMFPGDWSTGWARGDKIDFRRVLTSEVGTVFNSIDLAEGRTNQFVLGAIQLAQLEETLNTTGRIAFRLEGIVQSGDSLFTWDAGDRNLPASVYPILRIIAIPGQFVVVTQTPTPENVVTAAAVIAQVTANATRFGTPTPLPRQYATALPLIPISPVPTPANLETVAARSAFATAVALTTGTFTPTPSNFATYTPTPTSTSTPAIIMPSSGSTATPMPTPTIPASRLELIKTPIPAELGLRGKILFISNRDTKDSPVWVMSPNGEVAGRLTSNLYYQIAETQGLFSPDKLYQVDVGKDEDGRWQIVVVDVVKGVITPLITEERRAPGLGAYHPAWSPTGEKIAFVSERTGVAEIYVYDVKTKGINRLTYTSIDPIRGFAPYNKHPSWSPDGKQVVFFSDRGGFPVRDQIFIINTDGSDMHILSPSPYSDSNPVWIK